MYKTILLSIIFLLVSNNVFAQDATQNIASNNIKIQQQISAITTEQAVLNERINNKLTSLEKYEKLYSDSIAYKHNTLDNWLDFVAIILTFVAIILTILAVAIPIVGWRYKTNIDKQVDNIKTNTKEKVQELNEKLAQEVQEIEKLKQQIKKDADKIHLNAEELAKKSKPEQEKEIAKLAQVADNPASTPADKLQAQAYKLQADDNITEAINKWLELIQIARDDNNLSLLAKTYFNLGYLYYETKEFTKAIQYYSNTIALNTEYADAYYNRGIAYAKNGQLNKAITDYTKAIKLNPNDAKTYYNRGNAYAKKGQLDKAITDFDKALALNSKLVQAYYNRGNAYYNKEQLDKAIADYTEAIALNHKFVQAYYNRGLAYKEQGEKKLAEKDFNKAQEVKKQNK